MSRDTRRRSYAAPILEMVVVAVLVFLVNAQNLTSTSTPSSVSMTTIAPTPTTSVAIPTAVIPTEPPTYNTSFQVIIEFRNISWKMELLNKTSPGYIDLKNTITRAVENVLRANNLNTSVQVIEFKPGSVLAFLNIKTNRPELQVRETLEDQMANGTIGSLPVSKTLFSGTLFDVVLKVKAKCNDSQPLKGFKQSQNLTSAIQDVLPSSGKATMEKVSCSDTQNVSIVTIRVQTKNPSSENPSKELKNLKEDVENGRLGNFSLIPEWQAYIPGEKLFSVSFNLTSPSKDKNKTIEDLNEAITNLLGRNNNLRYFEVQLMDDNTTVIVKVGMKTAAPEQPREALKPLKESINKAGKVGNIKVVKSFKAYINPNTVTQKVFEVHFRLNVSCNNEGNIGQNQDARKAVLSYIDPIRSFKTFIEDKLQSLKCVKGHIYPEERFVQAMILVFLTPDAPDTFSSFFDHLYINKCKKNKGIWDWGVKIVGLTPTSPSAKHFSHLICGTKPKPTTSVTSTKPTKEPTSSGTPPIEPNPSLYVKVKLGITWGEFCSKLEHSLKQKIAWNLYDKDGSKVSPDRIIFINVKKNCAEPSQKDEKADVWFYVSKSGSNELHKCLTLKAYKVLKMFLENGNTKALGPDFEGKVIHVDLSGEDSSDHKTLFDSGKQSTMAVILIAVAGAVGLLLLTLACCCLFCCGANRRRRRKGEDSQELHVVHVDANGTDGLKAEKQKKGKKPKRKDETDGDVKVKDDKQNPDKQSDEDGKERVVSYENGAYEQGPVQDNGAHNSNKPTGGLAPLIVTSPAPDTENIDDQSNTNMGGQASDTASSGSGGSRRGSASIGGEGQRNGSKPPSPVALKHIEADLKDRGRRRSSTPSIFDDGDIPLTHKTGTVGIVALALRNRNEKKKEAEFKNLSKDVPEEEVKYPTNTQSKNRSPDVLPAPKTRVKLSSNPDYINANWIRDHKGQRRYIATQHPLHETAEDLWRMVWEQESRLVVMVNEEEKEKPTEFMDYLPRGEGNTKSFGGIEVTIKQISKKADYVWTTLNIADSKKPSSSREISHMRFTSWKSRAMPNVALFVGFVTATREVRKKYGETKAPTIVHCTDGLGFTGVYIAVDIGIKSHEESKTSVVDVFELSKNLRNDRHGIVCSLEHYHFIYQALYEYTVNYDESAEAQKR